jgi:hypothetical protein
MAVEGSCSSSLGIPAARRNKPMDSHAEVRALHRHNGIRRPAHFDLSRGLATKEVQEEFARRTTGQSDPTLFGEPLKGPR